MAVAAVRISGLIHLFSTACFVRRFISSALLVSRFISSALLVSQFHSCFTIHLFSAAAHALEVEEVEEESQPSAPPLAQR